MTMRVLRHLILISRDFYDFLSPRNKFEFRKYIKHERTCLTKFSNLWKFVKNTPLRVVFSTLFSIFQYIKHERPCLIYLTAKTLRQAQKTRA